MRKSTRWMAALFACGLGLAALIVAGPRLWLRTARGHRTVERMLDRILEPHVAGSVSVGRLHGGVYTGLSADDVEVRNQDGAIIGRAARVDASWRPWALVRHRRVQAVEVERPVLMLDRARWLTTPKPEPEPKNTVVEEIRTRDGQVSFKGTTFTRVAGAATLHSISHLDVHAVAAHLGDDTLRAFGTVGWGGRPTWVATRFAVDRGRRIRGRGEVFYTRGELDGEISELVIAAPTATALVGGRGELRLRARVQGTDHNVQGDVDARQDARALRLRVAVDPARGEARIGARLDGVPRPIRLRARARLHEGTLAVPSLRAQIGASRVVATGSLARQTLRAQLHLHLVPAEARLFGLTPAHPIEAQVSAAGPLRALAVRAQVRLVPAQLDARGRLDVPARSGSVQLDVHTLQPAQLWPGAPALIVSGHLALAGRIVHERFVGAVHLDDGDVLSNGRRLSALTLAAQVEAAHEGHARIHALAGRWKSHCFSARGELAWTRGDVALTGAELDVDGAHAHADARYDLDDQRVSVRADPLSLSPALLARVLGRQPAQPWTLRAALTGTRDDLHLELAGATPLGPARLTARLLAANGRLELPHMHVQLGDSHVVAVARYQSGRLDASLTDVLLTPALVTRLAPALHPAWPIHAHGALAGRPPALDVTLAADAGPSNARLSGRIAARQVRLVAHLDHFDLAALHPTERRVVGTLELAIAGRLDRGGLVGTLTIRGARGYVLDSPFYRGWAEARLDGRDFTLARAVAEIPGAKIVASGKGTLVKALDIGFGVVITNALALRKVPQALRIIIGINSILPGRSVEGTIRKRPNQNVEVAYHVVPIGVAQLAFLWRVLKGQLPRLVTPR